MGKVAAVIGHVHLGDARTSTSEGLGLGDGLLDLAAASRLVMNLNLTAVTEIWGGHLNGYEGFKKALAVLEEVVG